MSLQRREPRRTVTLSGFSFADGEVTLIDPQDMPHGIMLEMNKKQDLDFEDYFIFCLTEGVLAPEDFTVLDELSSSEVLELYSKLIPAKCPHHDHDDSPINTETGLTEAEEAEISDFIKGMGAWPTAADPWDSESDDDEGEEGDSGFAAV